MALGDCLVEQADTPRRRSSCSRAMRPSSARASDWGRIDRRNHKSAATAHRPHLRSRTSPIAMEGRLASGVRRPTPDGSAERRPTKSLFCAALVGRDSVEPISKEARRNERLTISLRQVVNFHDRHAGCGFRRAADDSGVLPSVPVVRLSISVDSRSSEGCKASCLNVRLLDPSPVVIRDASADASKFQGRILQGITDANPGETRPE